MERLRQDIMNQLKVLNSPSGAITHSSITRLKKPYTISIKGGNLDFDPIFVYIKKARRKKIIKGLPFIALKIKQLVEYFYERNKKRNILAQWLRLNLKLFRKFWNVNMVSDYNVNFEMTGPFLRPIFIGIAVGSAISWIGLGTTLLLVEPFLATLFLRSGHQQIFNHYEYITYY